MSDTRMKLCPSCKASNTPRAMNCSNCGEDIERVPALDLQAGAAQEAVPARLLPTPSPPIARALQAARSSGPGMPMAELHAVDGSMRRWSAADRARLGRGPGKVDLTALTGSDSVSRHHATLRCLGGQWSIEAVSETNPTQVNGAPLPRGQQIALAAGDTITLGEVELVFLPPASGAGGSR